MDLLFLESIKPESSFYTNIIITVCVAAVICLLSFILFRNAFLYISIPVYITAMVIIFVFIPMDDKYKQAVTQDKRADLLLSNIEKEYGLKVSKKDSLSIVDEYTYGSYNTHTRITVKENDKDIRVLYYSIEDSKLNFYRDMGNDTFSSIEK